MITDFHLSWPWWLVDPIIPAPAADVIRLVSGVLALVLLVAACYAVRVSHHVDQRVRFGLFALFAVLLTTGHLAGIGNAAPWRLPVLTIGVALAVWSTIKYVRRELEERRHGR